MKKTQHIAVLGGGISGLSAAYQLNQRCPDCQVVLYESSERLGGVIRTERADGYLIEHAADNFLRGPTAPWAEQLCDEIGFSDQLLPTDETRRGAKVVWNGRLHPVPEGFQLMAPSRFWPLLTSSLLSWPGKLRMCCEPFIREPAEQRDETLAEFATRRLGAEACQRLVEPLVSGIYTADPDQLSVGAALPQMVSMAREHGSLYRAMQARRRASRVADTTRGARYGLFVAPRGGMSDLIAAVAAKLTRTQIRYRAAVAAVSRSEAGSWSVRTRDGALEEYDSVIVALPVTEAAKVVAAGQPTLAAELNGIPCASSAVVVWGIHQDQLARPLDAFGCVVPPRSGRPMLAISYTSLKFPGRAPDGQVMLRIFFGGALQPEMAELADDALHEIVQRELQELLGLQGLPVLKRVVRWPNAMPQYHVGHTARLARIDALLAQWPGLALAGNAYEGVGIPQCVRSGRAAADRIVALGSATTRECGSGESPQRKGLAS